MGFRFRKSFGGKYFRINISKSGIGYSYGIPGFRKTIMANGRTRTTASIPGTGISYVTESSGPKNAKYNNAEEQVIKQQNVDIEKDIDNVEECLYEESSHEEFVQALKKAKSCWTWAITLIVIGAFLLFGPTFVFGILMICGGAYLYYYFSNNLRVNVEYEIENGEENTYKKFKEVWLKINKCKKIWEIVSEVNNSNIKIHAGAQTSVKRVLTKFRESKLPYLHVGEEKILTLKLRKKEVLFLQDKILIFDNFKVASVDYKDLILSFSDQRFVESEFVPRDSKVVDYTWTYVNKNGQPDKRYSNNRRLPICLYGKINISDTKNLFNIELQISSYDICQEVANQIKEVIKK